MADTLKKVVKDLPPDEGEYQSLKEKQNQVDALAAPVTPALKPVVEPGPPELVNPMAQYGSRQGEVRYAVDKAGNLTPIAVPQEPVMLAPVAPAPVAPAPAPRSGMKPIIPTSLSQPMQENAIPVYDRGGDVVGGTNNNARVVGGTNNNERPSVGMRPIPLYDKGGDVKMSSGGVSIPDKPEYKMTVVAPPDRPEDYMPRYGSEAAVANRPDVAKPVIQMKPIPLYDDGGDVDVNDGKHQVAIVQEGERVLTPDENAQYKAEHSAQGAPVGFSGMVLPNDKNVQPEWDSEHKPTNKVYPGGARMSIDNASIDEGTGDKEHFPTAAPTEANAKEPTPRKEERGTPDQREHLDNAVKNELGKGNFVGAGTALIQKNNLPKIDMDNLQTPSAFQRPGEPTLQMPGAGATPQGPAAPTAAPTPLAGKAAYHAKIQDYDTRYQALMDKAAETGDPQYSTKAEQVKAAKESYLQAHPWGSPESAHPGILGHIGHIASTVGNIAGDIVAPGLMAITPGTDIHKAIERGQTEQRIKEGEAEVRAQQNANTAENSAKNTGTVSQQEAAALRDKAAADATGDPKKIAVADRALADAKQAVIDARPLAKVPTGDEPLGAELVTQYNKELADRYQVLHPGGTLPQEFMLPPNATANDYNRRHTAMEGVEKATGVQTQLDTANQQKEQQAAAHKEEQAGKVYDDYTKQVDKVSTPMEAVSARTTLLLHNLDARNKQSDAQVAPELLSIASGGVGSGLRMNEAEISRVVGGRSIWDALIAAANKVREGEGTFSDEQRAEMHKIGEYIYDRSAAVTTVYSDAKDRMLADKGNSDKVRKDYNDAKRIANQIVREGIVPQGGKPKDGDFVFHNGQVLIVKGGKGYPALQ